MYQPPRYLINACVIAWRIGAWDNGCKLEATMAHDAALLGERIKALRVRRGLTQQYLATTLNVSAQAVSKWERGENAPDLFAMPGLAALLNTTVDSLLGYERRILREVEGTVFFSSHKGFTAQGERVTAEELAVYINSHFYAITECVLQHAGRPIKYMGDAFLGVFIAGDHAGHALSAARMAQTLAPDTLTVGVATGVFRMGPIGHPDFAAVDIIGDFVNLAARVLAWAGKNTGSGIGTTAATVAACADPPAVGPGVSVEIKGKSEPVTLHEVPNDSEGITDTQ
jgi:class 3 adenylate cyclase